MKLDYDKNYTDTFHSPGIEPWVSSFLKGKSPERIIDVGCGLGFTALLLRLYIGYCGYLVGLDIQREKVSKAKDLGLYDDLVVGDARRPPIKNNAFDALISLEVLHCLSSEALTFMKKIVEKNGSIILALPRPTKEVSLKDLVREGFNVYRSLLRGLILIDLANRKVLLARNSTFLKVLRTILAASMPLLLSLGMFIKNGYLLAFIEFCN